MHHMACLSCLLALCHKNVVCLPFFMCDLVCLFTGLKSLPDSNNPIYVTFINEIPENLMTNETFESSDKLPEGLEIISDFVSDIEENEIIKNLKWNTDPGSMSYGEFKGGPIKSHFKEKFIS